MEISEIEVGSQVCHKSDMTIVWIVEEIHVDKNEVSCSTLIRETLTQKKETFNVNSIEKKVESSSVLFSYNKKRRENRW